MPSEKWGGAPTPTPFRRPDEGRGPCRSRARRSDGPRPSSGRPEGRSPARDGFPHPIPAGARFGRRASRCSCAWISGDEKIARNNAGRRPGARLGQGIGRCADPGKDYSQCQTAGQKTIGFYLSKVKEKRGCFRRGWSSSSAGRRVGPPHRIARQNQPGRKRSHRDQGQDEEEVRKSTRFAMQGSDQRDRRRAYTE